MKHSEAIEVLQLKEIEIMGKPYAVWKFLEALQYAISVLDDTDWCDPAVEVPIDPDEFVQVCVSGTCGGITFDHAMELATYNEDYGWCIEWGTEDTCIEVHGLVPIRRFPGRGGCDAEIH